MGALILYSGSDEIYIPIHELGNLSNITYSDFSGSGTANNLEKYPSKNFTEQIGYTPNPSRSITQILGNRTGYISPGSTYGISASDISDPNSAKYTTLAIGEYITRCLIYNYPDPQTPADVYLGAITINNVRHLCLFMYGVSTFSASTEEVFTIFYGGVTSSLAYILAHSEYREDPGSKGFRPTGAYSTKDVPGVGGMPTTKPYQKTPAYYSYTTAMQPGAPDESSASAIRSGFINCYKMTEAQLDKVCECLYSDTLLDAIKNMMVNPLDFIVSLMIFPCAPDAGSAENIKFGKWVCLATGVPGALGTDMTGSKLTSQFKVFDFGSIRIDENWGNFLDYTQTALELYLPFIGSVNIDPSECMGGTINVQYTIDFFTGMCVANVCCERNLELPSGKIIPNRAQHSYQGNCAIQIPLSAVNYGSMIGSLINACTQAITNPVSGFIGVATDAAGGGFRPNVSSKGNIVANSGFCSILYPYVRITRPITAEPASYQEVMGYPSYINTKLSECDDLCICDEIDLKGLTGATENELNKIRQMCKDGVYV